MKPVDQIRTGYGRGQCTEASIASVLEIPLEDVPDLWAGTDALAPPEKQQPMERKLALWRWLREEHGLFEIGVRFEAPFPTMEEAWSAAVAFFSAKCRTDFAEPPLDYHFFAGPNPDGISHQVVGHLGKLAFDPNPLRRGIISAGHVLWLIPVELVPAEAGDLPSAEWLLTRGP